MSQLTVLRALLNQMLATAVETLFAEFQKTLTEHEDEICRLKEENDCKCKLQDTASEPVVPGHNAGFQQSCSRGEAEVYPEQQELYPTGPNQVVTETLPLKDEPEEVVQRPTETDFQRIEEELKQLIQSPKEINLNFIKDEPEEEFQRPQEVARNPVEEMDEADSLFWSLLSENDPERRSLLYRSQTERQGAEPPQTSASPEQQQQTTNPHRAGQGSQQVPGRSSRLYICPALKVHAGLHVSTKPFACGQCGRGFCAKSSLVVHMRRHCAGAARPQEN
ncbi:hypothetical protein CRUP_024064 [Coryphaenoides rupestris]|nr:hypothetical protein CRUP_024064 [Coryphaenoides rupestris]